MALARGAAAKEAEGQEQEKRKEAVKKDEAAWETPRMRMR